MTYRFEPSVVLARRSPDDAPLFLTESGRWTPHIGEAELIEDEAHGDIRLLDAETHPARLSGIRLAAVRLGRRGPERLAEDTPQTA